jgi:hypothetical protein
MHNPHGLDPDPARVLEKAHQVTQTLARLYQAGRYVQVRPQLLQLSPPSGYPTLNTGLEAGGQRRQSA